MVDKGFQTVDPRGRKLRVSGYVAILDWMFQAMSRSKMADLNLLIEEAAGLVHAGTPVRIECFGGKHRSVAISHAIARRCFYPRVHSPHRTLSSARRFPCRKEKKGRGVGGASQKTEAVLNFQIQSAALPFVYICLHL